VNTVVQVSLIVQWVTVGVILVIVIVATFFQR